jgi:hypothetical protein
MNAGMINGWDDTMTPPSLQMWDGGLFFFSNSFSFFILFAIPHCCEHLLAGCDC